MNSSRSYIREVLNRKNGVFIAGVLCCAFWILVALFAPQLELHDPFTMNMATQHIAPCLTYPFGTDTMGRCIYSRIIEGARVSLPQAASVVILSVILGTAVGLISGFSGGKVDAFLMRVVDVFLAFPTIVFVLAMSTVLGTNSFDIVVALALVMWTRFARVARGEAILLRNEEFIEAARAIGNTRKNIVLKYMLPSIASKIIVIASLDIGGVILFCSSLSFLGLGPQPPIPDWGCMVSEGKDFIRYAPWMSIFPGLAIAFASISFNLLGDGLRDMVDPRMCEVINAE